MNLDEMREFEFTAIMPVRNSTENLENIVSIANSLAGFPIQLVIVSDLHNPETETDLQGILGTDENEQIVLTSGDYNSPGLARNAGLNFALSDFVTFWDCDDKPIPESILQLVRKMRRESKDIAVGDFNFANQSSRRITRKKEYNLIAEITSHPGLWRMIFDRNKVELPDFKEFRMAEDQIFLIEIKFEMRNILREPLMVYGYRTNVAGQLTGNLDAISDTRLALRYLLSIYLGGNTQLGNQRLLVGFIAKQLLSSLKYGLLTREILVQFLGRRNWNSRNMKKFLNLTHQLVVQILRKYIR